MFGNNEKTPAASVSDSFGKEAGSWDDKMADALPKYSAFFNAMRTDPFVNHNLIENYVEFWAAIQVNEAEDKWRVMHYMVYDLDKADGKFVSESVSKTDVTFPEAVFQLARAEYTNGKMLTHVDFDMAQKYPPEQYQELKVHFFDMEHYKVAANIEGIAFDEYNQPYRKVQGKIFADATFKRSEVVKSILSVEQARDNEKVRERIEGGLVSDIFNMAAKPDASLDDKLKIGQVISIMDRFAVEIGAVYLAIRTALKLDESMDRVAWLSPEDRKDLQERAKDSYGWNVSEKNACEVITKGILPRANELLKQAQGLGVHTEPFEKFVAECDLYAHLVYAAQNLAKLEKGFVNANNADIGLITEIRNSVDKAQTKFLDLGGTQEQMDKLKAWVAMYSREEKDAESSKKTRENMIPAWLPSFMSRYYERRSDIMKKVQERNAGLRQIKAMSTQVKPPVTDAHNENKPPETPAGTQATPASDTKTGEEGIDFDKYKTLDGAPKKPQL